MIGLLCKVYHVWHKKVQRSYLSWNWRTKFKEKLTCGWKKTWGIWKIFTRTLGNVKIETLKGSFCPKQKMHELKTYRGAMCNDTEEWQKIWRGIAFLFQNWRKEFYKFCLERSNIYILMGCFWPKYLIFKLKKYKGVIFYETGEWCKILRKIGDWWFGKWLEEFGKFSPEHSKFSKLGLWWDPFIKVENVWA